METPFRAKLVTFWRKRLRRPWYAYWSHPICLFIPFVIFLSKTKENYPFTDYPMYSNPGPGPITYYYITNADNQPLPVQWHCGITSPRMKRRYERDFSNHRKKFPDITDAERHRIILDDIFPFLHTAAERRNRPLPDGPLMMFKGEIFQESTGFKEFVICLGVEGDDHALPDISPHMQPEIFADSENEDNSPHAEET